jgi:hypothetical protein
MKTNYIQANIRFCHFLQGDKSVAGVRVVAPQGMNFVPGFFCQFLVSLCEAWNVSTKINK